MLCILPIGIKAALVLSGDVIVISLINIKRGVDVVYKEQLHGCAPV